MVTPWPKWLVVLLASSFFFAVHPCWARCIHDDVQSSVPVLRAPALEPHPALLSSRGRRATLLDPLLPIRIRAWHTPAESARLSPEHAAQLQAAVEEATSRISRALAVRHVPGRLLLSRNVNLYCRSVWRDPASPNFNKCSFADQSYLIESCLEVTIPDEHLEGYAIWPEYGDVPREVMQEDGVGVTGADFILYVKVASTDKCYREPSVIAYASYCQLDHTGRPVAGAIIFCKAHLEKAVSRQEDVVQVTLHEVLHALGFSRSLFEKWKDCTYAPAIGVNCSSRTRVTNTDEIGQVRIFTPSVMKKMKAHLGGGHTGAPLENQDTNGLPSSHWEARVLQGSIMTASLPDARITQLDEITLAAFEDTGWYQVNGSAAERLVWGQGAGADFGLTSTCGKNSSKYFCTGSGSGCHYMHLHKGRCSTDPFLDGCRMYKPLTNGSECWLEGNHVQMDSENNFGEIYHADSRCFFSTLIKEVPLLQGPSPASEMVHGCCYLHRCVAQSEYQVKVAGSPWLSCPAGTSIQVPGYRGQLLCPNGLFCQNVTRTTVSQHGYGVTNVFEEKADSPSDPTEAAMKRTKVLTLQGHLDQREGDMQLSKKTLSLLANLAIKALTDFSGITRCHFEGQKLDPSLAFTVELWQSVTCPDSKEETLSYILQGAIYNMPVTFVFNGTTFTLVLVRLVDATLLAPTLTPVNLGHLTLILISLGLAVTLLLITGFIMYRKHRTAMQVQDAWRAPDVITGIP
ncbi:hypothetical protein NDU88_003673 [Pleurodeles waltl]|uniref:Leishmanolysin-like peptidase n=1 Tax=Pleurodeles waltl TaxID=8319 RepID=A0AAV7QDR5_PLEWA|nr:hypothetical protein NDU88_003673 [Pleurodeles waltl]